MRRAVYASIAVAAIALVLVLLLPVVPERAPPDLSSCFSLTGCQELVSVTYKIFSVGGFFNQGSYGLAYLPGYTCQASGYQTVTAIQSHSTMSTATFYTVPVTTCTPNIIVIP